MAVHSELLCVGRSRHERLGPRSTLLPGRPQLAGQEMLPFTQLRAKISNDLTDTSPTVSLDDRSGAY